MEVSKKVFSEAMGVSKAMVTKYVHKGLPLTPGGKVDLVVGRKWVRANIGRMPTLRGGRGPGAGR
jgi:phage terminase Nu1 subunit (DNA packaging protein)